MIAFLLASAVLCHLQGMRADPVCSPGAVDSAMTTEIVCSTRARDRRGMPPWLRRQAFARYGVTQGPRWVLDHVVPISLGGAPADIRNLAPQLAQDARQKDRAENTLHRAVCRGEMTLTRAQRVMMTDWTAR